MDRTQTRGLYSIALPNGRSAEISSEQLHRIARGMGDHVDEPRGANRNPPIVEALESLPLARRADALAVVLRRFGEKQDLESIAHTCRLTAWEVWQLEEAFRRALEAVARDPARGERLPRQLRGSIPARLVSEDLLANALAHGESVDLDAEHEASLRTQ